MHFHTAYPVIWLLASVLLALLASYLLYKANPLKLKKKWQQVGVMAFRFLSLMILFFLLLDPVIKWINQKKEKPVLVIAIDNSESMVQAADSTYNKEQLPKQLEELKSALADRFEIETYTLGEQSKKNESLNFHEKFTNLSEALDQISNDHYNLNHAATLLISDGIFNRGSNPVYAIQKGIAPIYTMALGDTTQHKDALISRVRHNATVFAGNDFELMLDLKAFYCNNEAMKFSLSEGNNLLAQGNLTARGNKYFGTQKIIVSKAKEGIHTYQLKIDPLAQEANLVNNIIQIQVNVLRAKQKVILLYQNPHPDIAALMRCVEGNPNYEIQSFVLSDYKEEGMKDASLFILHQIPGNRGEGVKFVQRLQQNNMPVFFVVGRQSGLSFLSNISALKIIGPAQNFNESQAWVNKQFNLFQLDESLINTLEKFAPLFSPYGTYQTPADAQVLLNQQIGYVKTNTPLLFFSSAKGYNSAYLCGEGFWRWRLQDFLFNQNQQQTQTFVSKILQWVAGKNDKSKFRVNPMKKFFDESEPVTFEAELYNDLYELINTSDISLSLKNQNQQTFNYQFSKTDKSYQLDLGNLPPGTYTYEASVNGNQKYEKKTGTISVKALQTESLQTQAEHGMLRNLAQESGGKFYYPSQWKSLEQDLLSNENMKTILYEQEEMKELLHQKWLFFVVIILLTSEWLIRKWNGFI